MPSVLPLSERVIENVVVLLQSIRKANGFYTDAGLNVFRSLRVIEESKLDAIDVWEIDEQTSKGDGSSAMPIALSLAIEGHTKADITETGTKLGLLKADIKRALCLTGAIPDTPNEPFAQVAYTGSKVSPRQDFANSEFITVNFTINYPEKYGDPSTSR